MPEWLAQYWERVATMPEWLAQYWERVALVGALVTIALFFKPAINKLLRRLRNPSDGAPENRRKLLTDLRGMMDSFADDYFAVHFTPEIQGWALTAEDRENVR